MCNLYSAWFLDDKTLNCFLMHLVTHRLVATYTVMLVMLLLQMHVIFTEV